MARQCSPAYPVGEATALGGREHVEIRHAQGAGRPEVINFCKAGVLTPDYRPARTAGRSIVGAATVQDERRLNPALLVMLPATASARTGGVTRGRTAGGNQFLQKSGI